MAPLIDSQWSLLLWWSMFSCHMTALVRRGPGIDLHRLGIAGLQVTGNSAA